jgi:histidinol-phosphatase
MPDDYAADLDLALRLADIADRISLERFGALDLVVETKPDLTPVSDADRAVEQAIRAALEAERPDDAVLGEEFGASAVSGNGRRWILDPIDATKNFVRGVPVWATLIALMDADTVVVGVVSAPALGHRWWAARGLGSWTSRAGAVPRRNAVSRVDDLAFASLSYSEVSDWGGRSAAFQQLLGDVWRTRAFGDFWSHVLVAEGAVDISAEPEVSIWDVAALVVVVEEAGGRYSGVDGQQGAGAGSVLCTNGLLHDRVLRKLAVSASLAITARSESP